MESTIHPSHPIDSISRKRAREEEEDLSADIPPQKRIRSQDTASLESTGIAVADPDQPRLTLSPPPEPCLRYETPSPETIPAILPSTSDAPARYKRKRDEFEFDTAAPSKRCNVAQKAAQTLPACVIGLTASWAELIEDALVYGAHTCEDTMVYGEPTCDASYGGETLVHLSSAPSSALSPSASQLETSTICDDTYRSTSPEDENNYYGDEIENKVVVDMNLLRPIFKPTPIWDWEKVPISKDWLAEADPPMRYSASGRCYVPLNAMPSSPLGPHFIKRNLKPVKLAGKGNKKVRKPSSSDRRISLLKRRAICVQRDTKQWFPRGFPQMRIPSVKLPASAKRKRKSPPRKPPPRKPPPRKPPPVDPCPPTPTPSPQPTFFPPPTPTPPPQPTFFPPPTPTPPPQPTFFPASVGELFQAGTHYTSASSSIQLDADLEVPASWQQTNQQWVYCADHGGYWMDYSTAMHPSASLHNTSWYTGPQQNEQTLFDDSSSEHTPLGSVSEISCMDHQFNDSFNFDLDSPLLFEPVQPVQVLPSYPSSPSVPLHSLSKDSELSPMHGYFGGMQGQVEPVVYLDEDVVETV